MEPEIFAAVCAVETVFQPTADSVSFCGTVGPISDPDD